MRRCKNNAKNIGEIYFLRMISDTPQLDGAPPRKMILMNNNVTSDDRLTSVSVIFQTNIAIHVTNRHGYLHIVTVASPVFWVCAKSFKIQMNS